LYNLRRTKPSTRKTPWNPLGRATGVAPCKGLKPAAPSLPAQARTGRRTTASGAGLS